MSRPEKVFKNGAVRAAVFRNLIQKDGESVTLRKVVLEVRYRDKNGHWRGTSSLSTNDLPKAIEHIRKTYRAILTYGPAVSLSMENCDYAFLAKPTGEVIELVQFRDK